MAVGEPGGNDYVLSRYNFGVARQFRPDGPSNLRAGEVPQLIEELHQGKGGPWYDSLCGIAEGFKNAVIVWWGALQDLIE